MKNCLPAFLFAMSLVSLGCSPSTSGQITSGTIASGAAKCRPIIQCAIDAEKDSAEKAKIQKQLEDVEKQPEGIQRDVACNALASSLAFPGAKYPQCMR